MLILGIFLCVLWVVFQSFFLLTFCHCYDWSILPKSFSFVLDFCNEVQNVCLLEKHWHKTQNLEIFCSKQPKTMSPSRSTMLWQNMAATSMKIDFKYSYKPCWNIVYLDNNACICSVTDTLPSNIVTCKRIFYSVCWSWSKVIYKQWWNKVG